MLLKLYTIDPMWSQEGSYRKRGLIDGPRDDHTKGSKSEKGRQIPHDITYMRNLKYDTNELIYENDSQTQRTDLWSPRGRGGRVGIEWEVGISRCKLRYIEWINNKVLLQSTGKYIQHPVINCNGKEYEKEYVYLNHFAVHQKLTQHCKSTILQFKKEGKWIKKGEIIGQRFL